MASYVWMYVCVNKDWYENETKTELKVYFPTKKKKKNFCKIIEFFKIHSHCQIWVAEKCLERLGHQKIYVEPWRSSEIIETDVVGAYEITVCCSCVFIILHRK